MIQRLRMNVYIVHHEEHYGPGSGVRSVWLSPALARAATVTRTPSGRRSTAYDSHSEICCTVVEHEIEDAPAEEIESNDHDPWIRCPVCADMEHEGDMIGGVCLTCADAIAFAQNARRGSITVPADGPKGWLLKSCVAGVGCAHLHYFVVDPAAADDPRLDGWNARTIRENAAPAEGLPTPQELIAARSVIRRLHRAVGYGKVRDVSGMEMWDSLVEGGRGIAVTTAYLGSEVDAAYGAAWEKMMDGDDHD